MSTDNQSGAIAFVCDVCGARFEADDALNDHQEFSTLWMAAKRLGWQARQQRGGKWHTACPECAAVTRAQRVADIRARS